MVLGVYHPCLLLITTPSYTFNARFTAPNAPPTARRGYPDPTGRTDRIFRHDDHKFEWTVAEFNDWCNAVADEWGYDVEILGVGRAQEHDEWGRDKELGFASQVAAFRRREGEHWAGSRQRKVEECGIWSRGMARTQRVVAIHHHESHPAAGSPEAVQDIGTRLKATMERWRVESVTLHELWFEDEGLSELCGGRLDVLAASVEVGEAFRWKELPSKPLEWVVEWVDFVPGSEQQISLHQPEQQQKEEEKREKVEAEVPGGTAAHWQEPSRTWTDCWPTGIKSEDEWEESWGGSTNESGSSWEASCGAWGQSIVTVDGIQGMVSE